MTAATERGMGAADGGAADSGVAMREATTGASSSESEPRVGSRMVHGAGTSNQEPDPG